MFSLILTTCVIISCVHAADLPYYITPCKLNDPNLNECATTNANEALKTIVDGDETYKVPSLAPLQIPSISTQAGQNLKLTLKDVIVNGLASAHVDLKVVNGGLKWIGVASFDLIDINGTCEVDGKILTLPISGSGNCDIRLERPVANYEIEFNSVNNAGEKYLRRRSSKITHTTDRTYYKFDNLFDGDKRLGDEMNRFMNENWQDLSKLLGPTLNGIVKREIDMTIESYTTNVPQNKLLLPD